MNLVDRLNNIVEELEGSGSAEGAIVAEYIRDELIPLAGDKDAELDAAGVVESLNEIAEWTHLAMSRVQKTDVVNSDNCRYCGGTGRNPMSDNTNWLTCQQCGGSGKGKAAKSA